MNDTALFLEKEKINNFDDIIEVIKTSGITPGTIAVEHIGDVIFFLNKRDKKRDMDDPELKRAAFTIIKTLLDLKLLNLYGGIVGWNLYVLIHRRPNGNYLHS